MVSKSMLVIFRDILLSTFWSDLAIFRDFCGHPWYWVFTDSSLSVIKSIDFWA